MGQMDIRPISKLNLILSLVVYILYNFFAKCFIFQNTQNKKSSKHTLCLFVCFVALRPKSTAMVMAERSVHLTKLFPGQAKHTCFKYYLSNRIKKEKEIALLIDKLAFLNINGEKV